MDPTKLCLGKLAPSQDPRTLRLASFVVPDKLPVPAPSIDYSAKVTPWPMYGNDQYGDCTVAAAAHMIELWGQLEGKPVTPKQSTVLSVYHKLSPNDQGAVEVDVLNYWRKTGIGGHHLYGFVMVDPPNHHDHIKLALSMFGGVYLGVALPTSAQAQTGPGKVWDVGNEPGSWGGHAINVVAYDDSGLKVVTWGFVQKMTWGFFDMYVDESYALLTADWKVTAKGSGIDFVALQAALKQITG